MPSENRKIENNKKRFPEQTNKKIFLRQETKNEILGVLMILIGIFLLSGLIAKNQNASILGSVGEVVAGGLLFLFGNFISFFVPIIFFFWGAVFFLGRRPENNLIKILGGILLVISLCSLFTIHVLKLDDKQLCFSWGGLIGCIFTHKDGIDIIKYMGNYGAYLLYFGLFIIGFLLSTDFLILDFINICKNKYNEYRENHSKKSDFQKTVGNIITANLPDDDDLPRNFPKKTSKPNIIDNRVLSNSNKDSKKNEKFNPKQEEMDFFQGYQLPPLSILSEPPNSEFKMDQEEIIEISNRLEQALRDFGITAEVVQVTQGPVITRFELQPAPGVKVNKIVGLANDISMVLKARHHVRILAPIPGKGVVGIEVPNKKRNQVYLREILSSSDYQNHDSGLAIGLGKTISGEPFVADLGVMPHLLIAGATGAGKSVCLNSIIASFLFKNPPDKLKLLLVDPKRVEFSIYQAIPHLISPVVCDPKKAAAALSWVVEHMEDRYKRLASVNARNIETYNKMVTDTKTHVEMLGQQHDYMPHIVIIIDELADLMIVAKADVEENITRLAQLARAVGIHLIIATQRPSVNVITGIIKANFPTRIAFQVSTKVDSRTILDTNGAESLIGKGDMLFSPGGMPKPIRVQGAFLSDDEVLHLVNFIKEQEKAKYLKNDFKIKENFRSSVMPQNENSDDFIYNSDDSASADDDELFKQAVKLILENKKASVSLIQRRMRIGYARAGRLMDMMEDAGIVGENKGSKPRDIIVDPEQYLANMREDEDSIKKEFLDE